MLMLAETGLTPEMKNFIVLLIAIIVVLLAIVIFGSTNSRVRRGVEMFLNEGVNVRRNRQNDNYKSDSSKSSKKQLTPGEAYYESDEGVQKYTSERQVEMATLIRKSDDRLRVIESTGQSRLLDEYYELVFKNRKGHIMKIECSRKAYEAIPFNQQGSLTYAKDTLVKFKYIDDTIYN